MPGVVLAHLQKHQFACQRNCAYVMPSGGFYGHDIAFLQGNLVAVQKISLAGVFELYLHIVGGVLGIGHVTQPVIYI